VTDRLAEYREHCVTAEQKAQEDYDKAVLSLSGGALGVSFAFIKDIVGPGAVTRPGLLILAWSAWGASIVATLSSYWFGQQALRTAIKQVDAATIDTELPGLSFATTTAILNAAGGLLFVLGVGLLVPFIWFNMGRGKSEPLPKQTASALTSLIQVGVAGPFDDADTTLHDGGWPEVERQVVAAITEQHGKATVEGVLLLGGVDLRPLSSAAMKRFGSNKKLALARAAVVQSRLRARLGDSIPMTVVPQGALELTTMPKSADWVRDRRVDIYLILRAGVLSLRER
jgi:hypothetical protein